MKTVTVQSSSTYDIIIGSGLLNSAADYVSPIIQGGTAAIVSDDKVFSLYGDTLIQSLSNAGIRTCHFEFPNGEQSKNTNTYIQLLNFLARQKLTRSDTLIALGGGVTGDMTGFAAATYMRGIKFIQIPTTLLAAVDSSVGGKTAIDLEAGKNLAGAFHQPQLVLCDYDVFRTLDDAVFADGMGEVIKHAVLTGGPLRELLQHPVKDNLEELVALNVSYKRDIVEQDEFETGARKLLNLGHTTGHAVEKLSHFSISHGCCVAIGTSVMARACSRNGICSKAVSDEIIRLFQLHGLPTETDFSAERIAETARMDKKRKNDLITLVWIQDFGQCVLKDISVTDFEALIKPSLRA